MTSIVVPESSARSVTTIIHAVNGMNPLDQPNQGAAGKRRSFRGLRGVFKITVTNMSSAPPNAYSFCFIMHGGTGLYRTDPSRNFHYEIRTAIDNSLVPVTVHPAVNKVIVETNEPITYEFEFPQPAAIGQNAFPVIRRIDLAGPGGYLPITGNIMIAVQDSTLKVPFPVA